MARATRRRWTGLVLRHDPLPRPRARRARRRTLGRLPRAPGEGVARRDRSSLAAEYVGDGYNFRDNQDHQGPLGRGIPPWSTPTHAAERDRRAPAERQRRRRWRRPPRPSSTRSAGSRRRSRRRRRGLPDLRPPRRASCGASWSCSAATTWPLVGQTGSRRTTRGSHDLGRSTYDAVATSDCAGGQPPRREDRQAGARLRPCRRRPAAPADLALGRALQLRRREPRTLHRSTRRSWRSTTGSRTRSRAAPRRSRRFFPGRDGGQERAPGRTTRRPRALSSAASPTAPEDGPRRLSGKRREGDEGGWRRGWQRRRWRGSMARAPSRPAGAPRTPRGAGAGAARFPRGAGAALSGPQPPTVHSQIAPSSRTASPTCAATSDLALQNSLTAVGAAIAYCIQRRRSDDDPDHRAAVTTWRPSRWWSSCASSVYKHGTCFSYGAVDALACIFDSDTQARDYYRTALDALPVPRRRGLPRRLLHAGPVGDGPELPDDPAARRRRRPLAAEALAFCETVGHHPRNTEPFLAYLLEGADSSGVLSPGTRRS